MKRLLGVIVVLWCALSTAAAADPLPKPLVTDLKNPRAVAVGAEGRLYVLEAGEVNNDNDGRILFIEGEKTVPFVKGLNRPHGMVAFQQWLFVIEDNRVLRIDK